MPPVSWLSDKSKDVKAVRRRRRSGMEPLNWLPDKSREVRVLGKETAGIEPVSKLPDKSREVRSDSQPKEGMVPEMRSAVLGLESADKSKPVTRLLLPPGMDTVDTVTPSQVSMDLDPFQWRNG